MIEPGGAGREGGAAGQKHFQKHGIFEAMSRTTIVGRQRALASLCTAVILAAGSAAPAAAVAGHWGGPSGGWRGQWISGTTGHQGPLGVRIRPTGPGQYRALFYGRFALVVPFAYRATLTRVPGTSDLYHSSKRLPLMGTYQTTARISGGSFRASYTSRKDRGVFRMSRRR